ncbi:MAG: hybrid sensor histidine kinase/response regulator [Spirochaetes bacterium]|nr:MAG: hybrid sensor histidine kinase/response regulator [Spirochaetota bacterium]
MARKNPTGPAKSDRPASRGTSRPRKENHRLDSLMLLPESCVLIDRRGIIIRVNEAFMRMFSIGGSHLSGEDIRDFISPADGRTLPAAIDKAAGRGRKEQSLELACIRRDGTGFPASLRLVTVQDGDNRHLLIRFTDLTGEMELRERMDHLQSLASIGTFASGVVHEFNNVLTGIRGYAQLAARDLSNSALLEKAFRIIESETRRGADLCKNMGLYSSRTQINPEPVSIGDLVDTVISLQRKYTAQEGIEVITDVDDLPRHMLDRFQIQQVLLNLVINARHAIIPKGGGTITIRARMSRGMIVIEVKDTGIGIDKNNISRIFDPFFTSKGPIGMNLYGSEIKGSGLGLAVSSAIIRKHQGTIRVESIPGEGSRFIVRLPAVPAQGHPREPAPAATTAPPMLRHPLNVLVVDDEMSIRELLFRALTARNIRVTLARNAEEATVLCKSERFDVVLLDYILPEKNGDHLIPVIREHLPDAKIVMLSGWSSSPLKKKKIEKEVSAWIDKPFEVSDLLATLSALTEEKGLEH